VTATPVQRPRSFPKRDVPRVELPADADELAAEAAAQLGWHGTVLGLRLLGKPVYVVAELRTAEHAERLAAGRLPVTDRADVSTWLWPELAPSAPPEAVEIVGLLSVQRHWRTGLAAAMPFARYYREAALVLPGAAVLTADYVDQCLPRARAFGLAVVSADEQGEADLDLAGRGDRELLEDDALTRWISEVVYARLVETSQEHT